MWRECSECGSQIECERAPEVCHDCGRAGVTFIDLLHPPYEDVSSGAMRNAWLRAGFEDNPLQSCVDILWP